jgi:cytochrome c oxidase assembly factor CtaG
MEHTTTIETKAEYLPTAVQLDRETALRRFNRLFVFLPIIIAAVIALIVVGLLFWVTLIRPEESSRQTVSGIASAVIILASLPLTILCALPTLLFIALVYQGRQKKTAPLKRVQTIFWRIDSLVLKIQNAVNQTMPRLAGVVIKAHAAVAYVRNLLNQLINLLKRS